MKIARFMADGKIFYGVVEQDEIKVIQGDIFGQFSLAGQTFDLKEVKLLAPVEPRQVIGIGLNYLAHIGEFRREAAAPPEPVAFMVSPSSVIGPEDEIIIPYPDHQTHHEAELVVVIGKRAHNIPREMAQEYILGYTCGNDVSDRDIQKIDKQWTRAKGYASFKPLGPWIETVLDPTDVTVQCRVNGQPRQSSSTAKMIRDVNYLVSFVSQFMTLYPGDVIYTGTPEGVGPLVSGDVCEIEIAGIGILKNTVVNREP